MCYVVRQQQDPAEPSGAGKPASTLRPRWIGAAAAAVVAGLALAAVVPPAAAPGLTQQQQAAGAPPVALIRASVPAKPVVEQAATGVDDGVPSAAGMAKAKGGDCHHGM